MFKTIARLLGKLLHDYGISYTSSFFGFLIIVLAADLLGADQFSRVAAGIAFGGFIAPLAALGSELTFVRDAVAAANPRVITEMAARSFGMRATVMLILCGFLVPGAIWYSGSLVDGIGVATVAVWAGLQGLNPSSWFDYLQRTREHNIIILAERIGTLSLLLVVWALPESFHVAAIVGIALLIGRAACLVVQLWTWTAVSGGGRFSIALTLPRLSPGISLPVTLALVSNAAFIYGTQLFLRNDKIELAAYGVAFQVMGLVFIFQGQALRLTSRKIATACKRRDHILRSTMTNAALIGGGSAVFAVVLLLAFPLLPVLLSDPKYEAMTSFSPLLCIWVAVAGGGISVAQHLLGIDQESYYLGTSLLAGLAALSLSAVFVPTHGGTAVAAILLIVHSLAIGANFWRIASIAARKSE